MINPVSLCLVLAALLTGICASASISALVRFAGWQVPANQGAGFQRFSAADWLTAMITGPNFLLRAAWEARREGEIPPSLFALVAIAAAGWAALLGLVLLQLAYYAGVLSA